MSLNSIWKLRATRDYKEPTDDPVHWNVTCYFYEFPNDVTEEELRCYPGRRACDFVAHTGDPPHGGLIWHAREWEDDEDDELGDKLTCATCKEMYFDI